MDVLTRRALTLDLQRDEGVKDRPYKDSEGIWTVGIGHNLIDGPPLTVDAIHALFDGDLDATLRWLDAHLPWWRTLDAPRQRVVANMAFNLGPRLLGFRLTLDALEQRRFADAAREMLSSVWARQVGSRADRLSHLCATGQDLP